LKEFTTARFEQNLSRTDSVIWVSENSVGIDGFIRIARDAEPPLHGCSDLEIATLYVQPRHQGSGTGRVLLTTGLEFCASTGRPDVWLCVNAENTRAAKFYVKNGFTKIGETQFQIEDQTDPNHVFRHSLIKGAALIAGCSEFESQEWNGDGKVKRCPCALKGVGGPQINGSG
jgi:ribosomal protein S18 acetylase RimI-like enzyme